MESNPQTLYSNQIILTSNPIPLWWNSLIILVGPSGSGKSTFANQHFPSSMCVSSDHCRAMISDSRLNQRVSEDAFEIFYLCIKKRLKNGYPAIADSTALKRIYRQRLTRIAKQYNYKTVLIFFDLAWEICTLQDRQRPYTVGEQVLQRQFNLLISTREELMEEYYDQVIVFHNQNEIEQCKFRWTSPIVEKNDSGPFDIIGDIHGCASQLKSLFIKLGYSLKSEYEYIPPYPRRTIFLGDIMDRGEKNLEVFKIVYNMWRNDRAYYIPGNHCNKLFRYLIGNKVMINHGLEKTIAELHSLSPEEKKEATLQFIQLYTLSTPYLILDNGRLVVSHAGILPKYIGRINFRVWECCLHGPAVIFREKQDPLEWPQHYSGQPMLVYGHIPVSKPYWKNNTVDIDLGAGQGGKLAALRYPEKDIISVGPVQ